MNKPYCVVGCTRGTGLRIVQQLTARGAPVRCIARDPVKAQTLLPTEVDIRAGDVTNPDSLRWAEFGECGAIFFAVDITGGIAGRGPVIVPSDDCGCISAHLPSSEGKPRICPK